MSLDIRRVRKLPYKKLEKPQPSSRLFPVKKKYSELPNKILRILVLISVFLLPAWFYDFSGLVGAGRIFSLTLFFGLIIILALISAWCLDTSLWSRRPFLTKISLILAIVSFLSSILGLDPKFSFGMGLQINVPLGIVLMIVFLFFTFFINQYFEAAYLKRILASYLCGSTVLAIYITVQFFLNGYESLIWVSRDGWLVIFSITILLLTNLAMVESRLRQVFWSLALLPHFLVLFLWDQFVSWVIILVGVFIWLLWRLIFVKNFWQAKIIYPIQIFVTAALLLFLPIKVFTGNSAPETTFFSYNETVQALKQNNWQEFAFGVGAGNGSMYMALASVSFFDPDPNVGISLFTADIKSIIKPIDQVIASYNKAQFFDKDYLNNFYTTILIEGGIVSALGWLILIIGLVIYGCLFLRTNWLVLKQSSADNNIKIGTALFGCTILLTASLVFASWSFVATMVWLLLFSLSLLSYKIESTTPVENMMANDLDNQPTSFKKWFYIFIVIFAIIIYFVVVIIGVRFFLATREASFALAANKREVASARWEKAKQFNPWNELYRLKYEESRLLSLSSATPLSEQKDIIESAVGTFAKINKTSQNPIAHWLVARLYVTMEKFVEGSLVLARDSYVNDIKIWPKNVALATELARLYRYRLDALVSSNLSVDALNKEAKDNLAYALKLSPEYLPAILESVFLTEKLSGITAAIAELAPWEETNPEIRYHLGRLYYNDGKLDIAAEKFKKVIIDLPTHANAHYSLAVIYYRQNKYQDSLKEFQKVLELNPGNDDVQAKIIEIKNKLK